MKTVCTLLKNTVNLESYSIGFKYVKLTWNKIMWANKKPNQPFKISTTVS